MDGMIGEDKMLARRFPIRTVAIAVGVSLIFAALVAEYVICHAVPVRSFNTQAWLKSESHGFTKADWKTAL